MRKLTTGLLILMSLIGTSALGNSYDPPLSPREFYSIWRITVGERIEAAMSGQVSATIQSNPMSVEILSTLILGESVTSLSKTLSGETPPSLELAKDLARLLDVPLNWLLAEDLIKNYETSSGTTSFSFSSNPEFLQLTEATKYFIEMSYSDEVDYSASQLPPTDTLPSCQTLVKSMISPELNRKLNPPPQ